MTNQPSPEEKRLKRIERTIDALKYHLHRENFLLQQIADVIAEIKGEDPKLNLICRAVARNKEAIESIRNLASK